MKQSDSNVDFSISGSSITFRITLVDSNSMTYGSNSHVAMNLFLLRSGVEIPFTVNNIGYDMVQFASYDLNNLFVTIHNNSVSIIGKLNDGSAVDNCVVSLGTFVSGGGTMSYMYSSCNRAVDTSGIPIVIIAGEHANETWCSFSSNDDTNYRLCYSTLLPHGSIKIPHYDFVISDYGVNTLNGIALILPALFYVREDPYGLGVWSYLGKDDNIGCVNMHNMSSYHIIQSDYPVSGDKYVCVSPYRRRTHGYGGIAIKLTNRLDITEDDTSVIPSIQ